METGSYRERGASYAGMTVVGNIGARKTKPTTSVWKKKEADRCKIKSGEVWRIATSARGQGKGETLETSAVHRQPNKG